MVGLYVSRCAVARHYNVVVTHKGFARAGFNANIGNNTGKHNRADTVRAQYSIEVGVVERTIAVLRHNWIVRFGLYLAVEITTPRTGRTYRNPRIAAGPLTRRLLQPDIGQVEILVGCIDIAHKHHEDASGSRGFD